MEPLFSGAPCGGVKGGHLALGRVLVEHKDGSEGVVVCGFKVDGFLVWSMELVYFFIECPKKA